jgi:hypothetical protein
LHNGFENDLPGKASRQPRIDLPGQVSSNGGAMCISTAIRQGRLLGGASTATLEVREII